MCPTRCKIKITVHINATICTIFSHPIQLIASCSYTDCNNMQTAGSNIKDIMCDMLHYLMESMQPPNHNFRIIWTNANTISNCSSTIFFFIILENNGMLHNKTVKIDFELLNVRVHLNWGSPSENFEKRAFERRLVCACDRPLHRVTSLSCMPKQFWGRRTENLSCPYFFRSPRATLKKGIGFERALKANPMCPEKGQGAR